jgi:calcineurin-like phosphoesterase family protein
VKITLKPSQQLFVTSDTHYNHKNICEGVSEWKKGSGQRPFQTLDEMNDALVHNINLCVAKTDILIHIGDWSFGGKEKVVEFRERLNVDTLILVLGNHDHRIRKSPELRGLFSNTALVKEITCLGERFVLSHMPMATWEGVGRGTIHLHGHLHRRPENRLGPGKSMDIGVDGNVYFSPYNITEVIELLKNRPLGDYLLDDYHIRENL